MPLGYICCLSQTHTTLTHSYCFVSVYGIPSVSTSKLVNKLFECKNSTLWLFKLVSLSSVTQNSPHTFYKVQKATTTQKGGKDGSLFLGLT